MSKGKATQRTRKQLKATPLLLQIANSGAVPKLLKSCLKVDAQTFLEKDSDGKTILDVVDSAFKLKLIAALEKESKQKEQALKIHLVLESALRKGEFLIFDKKGNLSKESVLAYFLEEDLSSFKKLKASNLTLDSQVPGSPDGLKLFHYYAQQYQSSFWKYISDNIDNLGEYGVNPGNALSLAVSAESTLADIHALLSSGVYLESEHLSIKDFKKYIVSCEDDVYKPKILNTISLFETLKAHKKVRDLIDKPHYSKVRNLSGNTVIHELAEQGREQECISLLKRKHDENSRYNDKQESIWHTAAKNNLHGLLEFLIENQKKHIDCLNANGLSPWAVAVLLGNVDVAKKLEKHGANTRLYINEEGQSLLHYAVTTGDDELVNRCFDCKVKVDVPDTHGYTPSFYAKAKGDEALCAFIEKFPGAKNADQIDLFNAVIKGDVKGLTLLLEHGVSPHLTNSLMRTALDVAEIHQHQDVSKILKAAGVKLSLTNEKISQLKKQRHHSSDGIRSIYQLKVQPSTDGPIVSIIEQESRGKENKRFSVKPWSNHSKHDSTGNWKIITSNGLCYALLVNNDNLSQPDAAFVIASNGDVSLSFANLPQSHLNIDTYSDFSVESISHINRLSVKANKITTTKQSTLFNGSSLSFEAKQINLGGKLSFKESKIKASDDINLSGELVTDSSQIQADELTLQGQLIATLHYSLEIDGRFNNKGNLIAGNSGSVKAHVVNLERNSVIMTQQGSLKLHGAARVNNSGAIIANQTNLSSNIIITNNIGAMVKGVSCLLYAPQVNQAGFVLSGQKSTLSTIDWALSGLHAAVNILEFTSYVPSPTAIASRGYLLIAKTLYRGCDLLRRSTQGESIQTSDLISLVLENIVPSIGFLSSSQEKATLLVNVLYQFYGAYQSEDKFIYKSLEFIEALTRALSAFSGGALTPENVEWLNTATQIINSSRLALKVADVSISAYQAWDNDDKRELAKAQANLQAITEVVFREALYKLEPYELIGFNLSVKPLDMIHFIMNQGHNSEAYLQSIVYGVLHAANRSGMLEDGLQNDLQTGARALFRMAHWKELYKNFKENKLTTHALVNETLNSLMVVLSSDKIRATFNTSDSVPAASDNIVVAEQAPPSVTTEQQAVVEPQTQDKKIDDIPQTVTPADIDRIYQQALEDIKQDIPEYEKKVISIDVEALAQTNLSSPSSAKPEQLGTTLLKSLIEVQKAVNGEYAAHGFLGVFVNALHNEGIMEVSGDIGLNIKNHGTNNHVIKATGNLSVQGQDADNRKSDGAVLSEKVANTIQSHFVNFQSGSIDAGEAIYLTCVGLIENFGDIKSLGKIKTTANRIIKNHTSGRIISKKDVTLLCDLLAKNEGQIVGENVHFEGRGKAVNQGTIIGVEKIKLMSEKLVVSAKGSRLVSKQVEFDSKKVEKEGAIQAEVVRTQGEGISGPESLTWRKDEEDNIGIAVIDANESAQIDKDAFNHIQLTDMTLDRVPQANAPLVDISPDFSNTLQLHLPQSDTLIPIWQLPKVHTDATFILDAPGARLSSTGATQNYDSAFRFIGGEFNFSADQTTFAREALFDVANIQGQTANSLLTMKEGGLFQADTMVNAGHIQSDDVLFWNVKALQNDAQLANSTEYFTYSKHNPISQACETTKVIENSGTIEALGHRGYVGNFNQMGGRFLSGLEGNFVYFTDSNQEAIQTQHGVNPTGILHDAGQNWYIKPQWHNAQIGSTGQNVFIGSGTMTTSGLSFWGDEFSFLYPSKGLNSQPKYARYEIDQILSLKSNGKVNGVMHDREVGYIPTKDEISSNRGNVVIAAPEGSIHLSNVVISSAGDTSLLAKDEVTVSGIAVEKDSSLSYKSKSFLSTKRVESHTHENLVYSSYIFTGGELIVRSHDFTLDAVQGVLGGADIVAHTTTLRGQEQTYQNTTTTKEFKIGGPGQDLLGVLKGHNAQAVFSSLMNACGWNQAELEALLNVKDLAELPKPLLNTARNAWNMSAFVAHACNEFGGTPSDFVGVFTDQMGLTSMGADNKRHFNPKFSFSSTKTTQETQSSQTISTNLFVGGTFRLTANELLLLDGASVDAEHLRIFLIEGIKATSGKNTYSYKSNTQTRSVGINLLNPEEVSVSVGRDSQTQNVTEFTLAKLHARDSAQVDGGQKIEGALSIQGASGFARAQEMRFETPQNTKQTHHRIQGANVSTAGAFGAHLQNQSTDEALTTEKAGIILGQGDVSANHIHLGSGSKIQASTLSRPDDEQGLPTITGTAAQDHSEHRQDGASFNFAAQGEPGADLSHSHKVTETIHRPTVLAENVTAQDLPGINTDAAKETEVVKDTNHGFAVAGFIPNVDKTKEDFAAMKQAATKGLHWLYGKNSGTPAQNSSVEKQFHLHETLGTQPDIDIAPQTSVIDALEALPSPEAGEFETLTPFYQFGAPNTWFAGNDSTQPTSSFPYNLDLNQDTLVPIYSLSPQDKPPLGSIDEYGRLNINVYGDQTAKPYKPFSLPSAVPLHDDNPVWDHIFGFCRGVEKARDSTVNALIHPIDTAVGLGTTVWDGYNAIGDLAFGLSTAGARERNAQRGILYNEVIENFAVGDSVYRTEMLSELGVSMIFGGAISGAPRSLISEGMVRIGHAIPTDYGFAYQSYMPKYFNSRSAIKDGKSIYRAGTKPTETSRGSKGIEGQFWAVEEPSKSTYAMDYGIPPKNVEKIDFAIEGRLKQNENFITRPAPGYGSNPGGAIEVVTRTGGVELTNPAVAFSKDQLVGNRSLLFQKVDKSIQTLASEPALGAMANADIKMQDKVRPH